MAILQIKHLFHQVYFLRINKELLPLFILSQFFLLGCNFEKDIPAQTHLRCIPRVMIETNKDSLEIGEVFEVKVSISDTTYLTVYDSISQKEKRFYPVFKVNDFLINNNFSDYFIVRDTVDNKVVYEEFPDYRQINLSVIFPHPIDGEGTVELSKLVSYTVIEN